MHILQPLIGIALMLALCWVISEDRKAIQWRPVWTGMLLAFVMMLALQKLTGLQPVMAAMNGAVDALAAATRQGTSFVFGYLGGGGTPFAVSNPNAGFVLAFQALPIALVVGALSALLFYWGVLPLVVRGFAWLLKKTMGVGGATGLSAAANVFLGQVEAPLVVKPYLATMTRGELFVVITCGMATIAGTVLVVYAAMLGPLIPGALSHLLICSFVSTPVAIAICALMVPLTPSDDANVELPEEDRSAIGAITRGTMDALQIVLAIVAMLIVFVALVALANSLLGLLPQVLGAPLTLERVFGWLFAPLAWLIGVPWEEAHVAGNLLGKKTVINEFLAYLDLAGAPGQQLSERSRLLMLYALCGFANFGSLGIALASLRTLLPPDRQAVLASLGVKSILAGLLSTCITAALVALVV